MAIRVTTLKPYFVAKITSYGGLASSKKGQRGSKEEKKKRRKDAMEEE